MEGYGDGAMIDLNAPPPEMEEGSSSGPSINQWPIRKVLTKSDADPNVCWIRLPVQQVRDHILPNLPLEKMHVLEKENPILINVFNVDISKSYRIKFKFRKSSSSYMLLETRPLVMEATLVVGQQLKFKWVAGEDGAEGALHFSARP